MGKFDRDSDLVIACACRLGWGGAQQRKNGAYLPSLWGRAQQRNKMVERAALWPPTLKPDSSISPHASLAFFDLLASIDVQSE